MTDGFLQPAQQQGTLGKIGLGLSAFGAGVQGRGQQFLAGQQAQHQQLSLERQKAAAEDLRRAQLLLKSGDIEGIRTLAAERVGMIEQLGGDPSDTMGIMQLAEASIGGDQNAFQALSNEINTGVQLAAEQGLIKLPQQQEVKETFRPGTEQDRAAFGIAPDVPFQVSNTTGKASRIGAAPSAIVSVGDKIEGAGRKRLGEKSAEQIALIGERSDLAVRNLQTSAQLRRNLDQFEGTALATGAFPDFRLGVANLAATLGAEGKFIDDLAAAEDFAGLSTKLQFAETEILKGAISEKEQVLAGRINTKMDKSGLGNRYALKRMDALSHAQVLHDDIIGQLRDENPEMPLDSVLRKSKQRMVRLPYVSEIIIEATA